jgi:hypothetical protein
MKRKWIFFVAPPALVVVIAIFGEVVMHLWNWLAPAIFGLHIITFWQALGLLVLCRILFGGFGHHGGGHTRGRHRCGERWERMTPEERENFRKEFRGRCGSFDEPAGEAKESA